MKDQVQENGTVHTILPVCTISGDETSVVLRVEMPGAHRDDIEVRIDGDQLLISGNQPEESGSGSWLLRERRHGNYLRSFTLDNTIDRDNIEAKHELGVMTLTLRVKEAAKPRRIQIAAQ